MASRIELAIGGMTCASCAARVEKRLNKLDGVTATVNYATEKASVSFPNSVSRADLVAAVEKAGYTADPVSTVEDPDTALRNRFVISLLLAIPVVAMSMVPALQFTYWQWASLALVAPVVVWAALPFHRTALLNLRHGTASMDTLISIGTLAAFAWSLYTLFLGQAGVPGMIHPFRLTIERTSGVDSL